MNNTQLSDREKANHWWMKVLTFEQRTWYKDNDQRSIYPDEWLVNLWRKETSPTEELDILYNITEWDSDHAITNDFIRSKMFVNGKPVFDFMRDSDKEEDWHCVINSKKEIPKVAPTTTVKEGEEGFTKGEWRRTSDNDIYAGDRLLFSCWNSKQTDKEAEANAHLIAASKDLYHNNDKNIDLLKELQGMLVNGNIDLEQTLCKVNERLFKSQEVRVKLNKP